MPLWLSLQCPPLCLPSPCSAWGVWGRPWSLLRVQGQECRCGEAAVRPHPSSQTSWTAGRRLRLLTAWNPEPHPRREVQKEAV